MKLKGDEKPYWSSGYHAFWAIHKIFAVIYLSTVHSAAVGLSDPSLYDAH